MRKFMKFCLGLTLFFCFAHSANAAEPVTVGWLEKYLKESGYVPTADENRVVSFKKEGRIYFCMIFNNDQDFVTINTGDVINKRMNNKDILYSVAKVSDGVKKMKASVIKNKDSHIWMMYTVELLTNTDHFSQFFERALSILDTSRILVREELMKK